MKLLTGLDSIFLFLETPEMPMHVGALNVYELPARMRGSFAARIRRHMAERMPLMPALRRRPWWMPLNLANPAWVDAEPDMKWHVIEHQLPESARQGDGVAELEAKVGELHAQRLDRERPLWRFHVLEGLSPAANGCKRVGVYSQFHHAAVDGQAAVALANVFLDASPDGRKIEAKRSSRERVYRLGVSEMLRSAIAKEAMQVVDIVKGLPDTVGTLSGAAGQALRRLGLLPGGRKGPAPTNLALAPRTAFNQSITTGRTFAGVSLPLAEIKAIGRAHEATINDIVLFICSTALRQYLLERKALPRKSLITGVPITLRVQGDTRSDNQASMSTVSLGTNLASAKKRLEHIKAATAAMKATMGSLRSVLPTDFPSIGAPWLLEAASALYGKAKVADRIPQLTNLVISNVPGPPVPVYLAGARMTCNYPTSIVVHGVALNITVESYDQQMDFGLVADAKAVPDLRELAKAIEVAFVELRELDHVQRKPAERSAKPVAAKPVAAKPAAKSASGAARKTSRSAGKR